MIINTKKNLINVNNDNYYFIIIIFTIYIK